MQVGQNAQLAVQGPHLALINDPNAKLLAVLVENTPETGLGRVLVIGDITMFTDDYLNPYPENRRLAENIAAWSLGLSRELSGNVQLGQYGPPPTGIPVSLSVYAGSSRVDEEVTQLDALGNYWVAVEAQGIVDVVVKPSHWLSVREPGIDLGVSGATVDFVVPINGDADGDDLVGLADLARILVTFATSLDPNADLDGSGLADLQDLNIVLTNFAKTGDG
ncbi:MAG: hypothetical protein AMXMBFR61_23170 [Fimbriimonadales bacterium]